MTDVYVSVQGSAEEKCQPELAIMSIDVEFERPQMQEASSAAATLAASLKSVIESASGDGNGPIARWTAQSLRTWSSIPWGENGRQLARVFHAGVSFSVTFSDFEAMSKLVETELSLAGINVGATRWVLTDDRDREVTERVRAEAVRAAAAKARSYAEALDLEIAAPREIADVGLLTGPGQDGSGGGPSPMMMRSMPASDQAVFGAKPEEITVSAQVQARFVARPRA